MTSLLCSYGYGRAKAAEADAFWIAKDRARDGTAAGVVMGLPHNYAPAAFTGPGADEEARAIAAAGMPVMIGGSSGQSFGNDAAIDTADKVATYLTAQLGCRPGRVGLFGLSMGGLQVCNWARQHIGSVSRIALVTPALDLLWARSINPTYEAEVDAAYGGLAGVTAALPTHSPVVYAAELAPIEVGIWFSSDDDLVPYSTLAAFAGAHGNTTLIGMGAVGHAPTAAAGAAVAAWLAAA